MESNILRPDWLTEKRIEQLKDALFEYPNIHSDPFRDDEYVLDGAMNLKKLFVQHAYDVLTKYNIPFSLPPSND